MTTLPPRSKAAGSSPGRGAALPLWPALLACLLISAPAARAQYMFYNSDASRIETSNTSVYAGAGLLGANGGLSVGYNGIASPAGGAIFSSNVGIGTGTPVGLLTIGNNLFQVNASGNLVKINNIAYSWPASQGGVNTFLRNDGSGNLIWSPATGDNLGNHIATTTLNLNGQSIVAAASATFTQAVTASSFTATGIGVSAVQLRLAGNVFISSEASAALGGGVRVSSHVAVGGFLKVGSVIGGGAELRSTAADNLTLITANNAPNPNMVIGYGNGAGGVATTVISANNTGAVSIPNNLSTVDLAASAIDVANDILVGGTGAPGASRLELRDDFIVPATRILLLSSGTADSQRFFNVFGDGRVGIGTVSPAARIDVLASGAASNVYAQIWRNSAGTVVSSISATGMFTLTGGAQLATGGGNVGIGTTSPGAKFTIGANQFQVSSTGDLVKVNNVAYAWPAAQAAGASVLRNDGSGNLTWAVLSSDNLGNHTATMDLNMAGNDITNAGYLDGSLYRRDLRTIAPSDETAGTLRFGFTSWANNNSSPYADFLHLRSYTDGTGGSDNLVMFSKTGIGMRIWQQAWGSATPYASYKDIAFTDASNAAGTWPNADTVDNLHATDFLRKVAAIDGNTAPDTLVAGQYWSPVYNNNYPTSYGHVVTLKGGTGSSATQLALAWPGSDGGDSGLWVRGRRDTGANIWGAWSKVWTDRNDGSGSTLDADLLDGLHKTSFGANIDVSGNNIRLLNSDGTSLASITAPYASSAGNADTVDSLHKTSFGASIDTSGNNIRLLNSDGTQLSSITPPYATNAGSASNADTVDSLHATAFLRAAAQSPAGNAEVAQSANSSSYSDAAIELRELNFAGAQTGAIGEAPRISFHWGGRVASQIAMPTDGSIQVRNNPGTGYETFKAGNIYSNDNLVAYAGGSNASGTWPISVSGSANYASYNYTTDRADAGALGTYSGFYQTSAPAPASSWPGGASGWWHLLDVRHSNLGNNYAMQMAGSFYDQNFYVRKTNNSASTGWSQLITSGNIGTQSVNYASSAGSASNSDTVDSLHASAFFQYPGWVTSPGYDANTIGGNRSGFTYSNNAPWTGPMAHFDAGGYGLQLNGTYSGGNNISFRTRNGDSGTWNGWKEFIHSGNIGSQTVSNSDMLDGYHKENFPRKDGGSYYQFDTWLQSSGSHGLYFPSSGSGTHWQPNTATSYGSFLLQGTKNGYYGIQFGPSTGLPNYMYDGSGNGGIYYENYGWLTYYIPSARTLNVNTSSNLGYNLGVNGSFGASSVYDHGVRTLTKSYYYRGCVMGNGLGGNCNPAACASGDTDLGNTCLAAGSGVGYCEKLCCRGND